MKKQLSKMLWGLVMVVSLTGTLAAGLAITNSKASPEAAQTKTAEVTTIPSAESGTLYAERDAYAYTYYYRTHNGWLQRRKWNRTLGRWAESSWHNVQRAK